MPAGNTQWPSLSLSLSLSLSAIYEVPVQVRGHADVVYVKVKVMLANKVTHDRFKQIWAILDIW